MEGSNAWGDPNGGIQMYGGIQLCGGIQLGGIPMGGSKYIVGSCLPFGDSFELVLHRAARLNLEAGIALRSYVANKALFAFIALTRHIPRPRLCQILPQ
jgi:hypothetical protein